MECAAAREVLDVLAAVQAELLDDVRVGVFYDVEIAVVAVARHEISVLAVPARMLHAHVFCRNHFAVEEQVLRAIFLVEFLHHAEHRRYERGIFFIVGNRHAEAFGGFHHAVHAHGEVLPANVDVAGVEERQHTLVHQVFEVVVVGHLHLVHEVYDVLEVFDVRLALARGLLDAAVEVYRQHRFRTGAHAARAEGVAEAVVLDFVAQAAARCQRVGIVAHVGEERVAGGIHLGCEVAILLVDHVAVLGEQRHRLDGEREHGFRALLVKPAHEAFLQPAHGGPRGLRAVGEVEVAEDAFEIVFIVIADVPEHRLEVSRARGLVDGVDYLLEAVGDDLVDGAGAEREVGLLAGALVVVRAIFLFEEVAHIHQELRRGAGAGKHARNDEYHVYEAAAERFEVRGRGGVAADALRAAEQPRVHRDRGAVVGEARLVVLIYIMVLEEIDVAVGGFLAVEGFNLVAKQTAVQADKALLGEFADERGDVLVLHVGVGVVLGAGGGVGRVAIVDEEAELVGRFAVVLMALTVEHESFCGLEVAFRHQCHLHLVLYVLHAHAVAEAQVVGDGFQLFRVERVAG